MFIMEFPFHNLSIRGACLFAESSCVDRSAVSPVVRVMTAAAAPVAAAAAAAAAACLACKRCYGDVRYLIRAQDGGGVVAPLVLFLLFCHAVFGFLLSILGSGKMTRSVFHLRRCQLA